MDTKVFLAFCNSICWFNPLVWVATRKAAEDLELSCDEIVTEDMDERQRRAYAGLLLSSEEYAPKKVIAMLNGIKEDILCVRGNCDTEVDQMVLDFPILADYAVLDIGSRMIYATHGHIYNEDKLPPLHTHDILLYGHTHIPICHEHESCVCMNPGSISIPKGNSYHGYMTLENGTFLWKDLDRRVKREYVIKG